MDGRREAWLGAALLLAVGASPALSAGTCCCSPPERPAEIAVAAADPARTVPQGETSQTGPEAVALPDREKKVSLGADRYFVLVFDKRPAMGTVIAKVELYSAGGARDTSLEVLGNVDMPSMRGAHSLGDRPFQLNKKGDYLLPMGLVMPGEWEIALTFRKDGRVLFRGYHRFKV